MAATSEAPALFHPAFAADRQQTSLQLRSQLQRYEDKFRELLVVLELPANTSIDALPMLVEERLRRLLAGAVVFAAWRGGLPWL